MVVRHFHKLKTFFFVAALRPIQNSKHIRLEIDYGSLSVTHTFHN